MGIAVAIGVFLALAVIAWLVYSGVSANRAAKESTRQMPDEPGMDVLHYRVPDGQDATVVLSALERAGYHGRLDDSHGEKYLVIACPQGRDQDRGRVREVLDQADSTSLEGPALDTGRIVFEDEKH